MIRNLKRDHQEEVQSLEESYNDSLTEKNNQLRELDCALKFSKQHITDIQSEHYTQESKVGSIFYSLAYQMQKNPKKA